MSHPDAMHPTNILRDRILIWSLRCCAAISAGVILVIAWFVAREAMPALEDVGVTRLFGDDSWHPTAGQYNMLPMVVGTLSATIGSLLLTAPLGVGSAVFLNFYASRKLARVYRRVIEVLAGVPSVVYGL